MGKYRKLYLTVNKEDYEKAHDILEKFYNRGDIDSITIECQAKSEHVLIGVECSTDDYLLLAKELGIELL